MNTVLVNAQPDADARIHGLRNLWVPYPVANQAIGRMTELLQSTHHHRPECLAIVGEPGFGKSSLLHQFVALRQSPYDPLDETPETHILRVDMPANADAGALLREILRASASHFGVRDPVDELMFRISVILPSLGIRILLIDEFHNGFRGGEARMKALLRTVRELTYKLQRPLVLCGTSDLTNFLVHDDQLKRRFPPPIELPRWSADHQTRRFLKTFELKLGLRERSDLPSPELMNTILGITGGVLGSISLLLCKAAAKAIEDGSERITPEGLRAVAATIAT